MLPTRAQKIDELSSVVVITAALIKSDDATFITLEKHLDALINLVEEDAFDRGYVRALEYEDWHSNE
jgi:hypothetical protein